MFISELDVVNECIASLGESPLNAIDEDHPLIAPALRMLRIANMREQAKGWWFNRETVILSPDPNSGYVYVPEDTINIDPTNPWTHLVVRGNRLYDPQRDNGYVINARVVCTLLRRVPFEDLPALAAAYVSLCVQQDFQKAYDADRLKYEQIVRDKQEAYLVLRAEDIRNAGVNLLYRPSTLSRMNALGLNTGSPGGRLADRDYGGSVLPALPAPPDNDVEFVDFAALFNGLVED